MDWQTLYYRKVDELLACRCARADERRDAQATISDLRAEIAGLRARLELRGMREAGGGLGASAVGDDDGASTLPGAPSSSEVGR